MNCLIVGCGYVGNIFADYAGRNGWRMFALTRTQERASELSNRGIKPIVANWLASEESWELPHVDCVLVAVSHAPESSQPPFDAHLRGLKNIAAQLRLSSDGQSKPRLIYLSTTGVYGTGHHGAWIDEQSPAHPVRPSSIAAITAEQWLISDEGRESFSPTILRLAGIYGPDRVPNLAMLQQSTTLAVPTESYLNLIHVADIARIIYFAMNQGFKEQLYCVSDGNSVNRRDYYHQICRWMNWPIPEFTEPTADQIDPAKRGSDSKRINIERLRREWTEPFLFPSFVEGLRPLLVPN